MLAQASRGPRRFIVPSLRVQRVKDIVRAFAHALEIKAGVDRAGDLVNIEGRAMKLACLEHLSSSKPKPYHQVCLWQKRGLRRAPKSDAGINARGLGKRLNDHALRRGGRKHWDRERVQ